ncbi:MAG: cytochrome-c peroxidase, partial [Bacteroidia bacterium]
MIIGLSFTGNQQEAELRLKKAAELFAGDADSLLICAKQLQKSAENPNLSAEELKKHFAASRKAFKRTELITAYFFPATEQMLNSPPIPEADEEEGTQLVRTPEGLQHIGELIYADTLSSEIKTELEISCRRFTASCFRLKQLSASAVFTDWQLMEALRFEVIRMYSLGLAGFDTPEYPLALADAKSAAESVQKYATLFSTSLSSKNKKLEKSYRAALAAFVKSIPQNKEADDFDRLNFIRSKANPLSVQLTKAAFALGLKPQIATSAMRWEAATPFERGAIDPWFYARSNRSEYKRKEVAELGRILFFEPLLSGNGLRSCASCHQPGKSFTDGLPQSTAFTGKGTVLRNSPTLINAAL